MIMIKPAGPYLDLICQARQRFDVPIAAYQVSGEYSMIVGRVAQWLAGSRPRHDGELDLDRTRRRRHHSHVFRQARRQAGWPNRDFSPIYGKRPSFMA